MAKPATGEVIQRERKSGRVFALRFRAYGRRHFVTLGGADAAGRARRPRASYATSWPTSSAGCGRQA